MLYKIMRRLFSSDNSYYRYVPRPSHLLYAIALMFAGTLFTGHEFVALGVFTFIFGVAMGLTILVGMNWDKVIEYWSIIDDVVGKIITIKDVSLRYEILKSLGYQVSPSRVEVFETRVNENGVFEGEIKKLPVSPAVLQMIADKALHSGQLDFTQKIYGHLVPSFRDVQRQLKDAGYIIPKNKRNVRGGYMFNKKGVEILYQYASEGVKMELKRKGA